jgi:hypothetical protein
MLQSISGAGQPVAPQFNNNMYDPGMPPFYAYPGIMNKQNLNVNGKGSFVGNGPAHGGKEKHKAKHKFSFEQQMQLQQMKL